MGGVACVAPAGRSSLDDASEIDHLVRSAGELSALTPFPDTIIVDMRIATDAQDVAECQQEEDLVHALHAIRGMPLGAVCPLFLTNPLPAVLAELGDLADGIVATVSEARHRSQKILDRMDRLHLEALQSSPEYRLLAHLFVREDSPLEPIKTLSRPAFYAYPRAEAIGGDVQNVDAWLHVLQKRGLLSEHKLVDRLRHCPKCVSTRLNYIDICPQCRSINIEEVPFLHCFTCGNVAPQEEFVSTWSLSCPRCRTTLRHIGVDYDRPLENYICHDCGAKFSDPLVVANCMDCDGQFDPDELLVRKVSSYVLSEKGHLSVLTGNLDDVYSMLEMLNFIHPTNFNFLVDWMLRLTQRYPEDAFSIIGINLLNVDQIAQQEGMARAREVMDGLAGRIRGILRSTDLTTRTASNILWLLLPKTDAAGGKVLLDRIKGFKNLSLESGASIDFDTVLFTAPRDHQQNETAELLIARLAGEMQ